MIKRIGLLAAVIIIGVLFFTAPTVKENILNASKVVSTTTPKLTTLVDDVKDVEVAQSKAQKIKPVTLVKPETKQVRKLTLDLQRTIYINGPIGSNALRAASVLNKLSSESDEPIYIILTSPGGSVVSGAALISAMQASQAPIYTVCYAFCASMASMIHQYGTRRYVTDRSLIMFHPASAGVQGTVDEIYSYTTSILKYVSKIEYDISRRIGWKSADYKRYVRNELWVDSDEAKVYNIADQIVFIRLQPQLLNKFSLNGTANKTTLRRGKNDLIWIWEGRL